MTSTDNAKAGQEGLAGVAQALAKRSDKSFAPVEQRGIHELLAEAKEMHRELGTILNIIVHRMSDFSALQARFYDGEQS